MSGTPQIFDVDEGDSPLILAFPHDGLWIEDEIWQRLNARGQTCYDTDWHIFRLYQGLVDDVTLVRANFHRYVIDANRDPEGVSLYPGANTTSLIPETDFDGEPIWQDAPSADDREARLQAYHRPYHQALTQQIARLKKIHKRVIIYDCHSIRNEIPFLFSDILPDLNIGDNSGGSCDAALSGLIVKHCEDAPDYSHVHNGRFKGGWTTRHYGKPHEKIHAIQMELAQSTYLTAQQPPFAYNEVKAKKLRLLLKAILESTINYALDAR